MKVHAKTRKSNVGTLESKELDLTGNFAYTVDMLRQYRLKLNISQEQLADELGISVRTLRSIELSGKRKNNKLIQASIESWIREVQSQERMAKKSL